MPRAVCASTISSAARPMRSESARWSTGSPRSWDMSMSRRSGGRGRLPTWVTTMWSSLRSMGSLRFVTSSGGAVTQRLDGVAVLAHGLARILSWLAPEPAVHRDSEVLDVLRRCQMATPESGDAVERQHDPEEHPCVCRPKCRQRREEPVVLAAQVPRAGEMQPVHLTTGMLDCVVGHAHKELHVAGLEHRPLRKRAVAEVVADESLLRDEACQPLRGACEALPRVAGHPRDHALQVEDLVADVPLDREIAGRDLAGESLQLARNEVLVGRQRDRVVTLEVHLERVQRAGGKRQAHLEPQSFANDALGAQFAEHAVRLDRLVDARP